MIDIKLQQDSKRRLREIKQDIKEAKTDKVARQLKKELQKEQEMLKLIERVEVEV